MDNTLAAVGAVLSGGFAIVIGYFVGRSGNPSTQTVPTISQTITACPDACAQLESARQASCLAAAAVTAANNRVGSLNAQLAIAWTVATALWAAVIAAVVIPAIGWIAGAVLATIASAATAFALYLVGQVIAAQNDQSDKQAAAAAAMQAVVDARNVVLKDCTGQELTDCLSRPSPCGP